MPSEKKPFFFTQNQCPAPLCNPSRCAILSGISPYRSGVFSNDQNPWQDGGVFNDVETLPECFKRSGYESIVAGKVFHTDQHFTQAQLAAMFDDYEQISGGYGPFPTDPAIPKAEIEAGDWLNYQLWTGPDSDFPDVRNTDKIVSELSITNRSKPFLMSLGLYRPHSPFTAPSRFFDMNPLEDVILPAYLEDDLSDVPEIGKKLASTGGGNQQKIMDGGWWRPLVRAYYACISFADWNFGRVMTALENSPYADNTIVIVCADNGLHNGEKDHWSKETLWDKSSRTLLMIRVPGLSASNSTCENALSSIHLYPTLVDLCSLTPPPQMLDGYSLREILSDPVNNAFSFPALTSYQTGNFGLRDRQYRYIQYRDQTDEFYDHETDTNEWTNSVGNEAYAQLIARFQQSIPERPKVSAFLQEHFATGINTTNHVPGWTAIAKYADNSDIGESSELLTGGLDYGDMITGIAGLKLAAEDGYIHNDSWYGLNRFVKPLEEPIDFPEGTVLYFSAQIKGSKRANFGLGNADGTSFPNLLISIGINPQLDTSLESGHPEMFSSSVWMGDSLTAQYNDQNGVKIPENKNAKYFIVGRLVNRAGTDEISYHVFDLDTSVHVPSSWSDSLLSGATGYCSRTNYNFGGDLVFSNLFINLQNNSGLDEICFGNNYSDIVSQYAVEIPGAMVHEHFETSADTENLLPGWTSIAKFEDNPDIGASCGLLTGGLEYGTAVTGINRLKAAGKDGYVHNDNPLGNNRFAKTLPIPIDFSEGTALYFSAMVKGDRRANFGLGTANGTAFPHTLISIGVNPQLSKTEPGYVATFSSSIWLGDSETAQYDDGAGIPISTGSNGVHLIIGRLVNNSDAADEISFHVIDLTSSVNIPNTWVDSALSNAGGFYSRRDCDFGGDHVFSNLFINLQNYSGLDEIYFSPQYRDLVP